MARKQTSDAGEDGFGACTHNSTGRVHAGLDGAARRTFGQRMLVVALSLALPVLLVIAYGAGLGPAPRGALGDSDSYLRLVRVRQLYRTGLWYHAGIDRANTPYGGQVVHWTRPVDVLLLAGAAPLAIVTDFETSLFLCGVVLGPILFGATLLALLWAARPVLDKGGPLLAALLFPSSLVSLAYFGAGQPDHHSLLILLFVLFLGFVLRQIEQPFRVATCCGAGAVGALSMWVSVESQMMIALAIVMLALLWIHYDGDFLPKNLYFSLSLFGLTCVALALERAWGDWLTVEFDRISIVHCCLFALPAVLWTVVFLLRRRAGVLGNGAARLLFLMVGAAGAAGLLARLFPGFYRGPLGSMDPRAFDLWLRYSLEAQPLLSGQNASIHSVPLIASTLVCLPFLVLWTARGDRPATWVYITLSMVAFTLLSFQQRRWTVHAQTIVVLPLAQIVASVWTWMDRRLYGNTRAVLKGSFGAGSFLLLAFAGVPAATSSQVREGATASSAEEVSARPICEYLEDSELWRNQQLRIVTHITWGAEILYRTRHAVVATGCHRDTQGILDTYAILTAERDENALRIIRARGIDAILLLRHPEPSEARYYAQAGASTLYRRLCDGHLPSWCREVTLPDALAPSFRVFEVQGR